MTKVLYFLLTFLESGLAIFGIRGFSEQPPYTVVATLGQGVEIRRYGPTVVAETDGDSNEAFGRLFRYITGANRADRLIKMTTPVSQSGGRLGDRSAMMDGITMRFVLPRAVAADPPVPSDATVRVVTLPARTVAAIRFSGSFGQANIARHLATLKDVLARAGREMEGAPSFLGYDPPFTIPFLRRNEVAVDVKA